MNENANFLSEVWQHVAERAAAVQALTLAKCAWASGHSASYMTVSCSLPCLRTLRIRLTRPHLFESSLSSLSNPTMIQPTKQWSRDAKEGVNDRFRSYFNVDKSTCIGAYKYPYPLQVGIYI